MGSKSWLTEFGYEMRIRVQSTMAELKLVIRRVRRDPLSIIGVIILLFFIVVGLLAPLLAPPLPGEDPYICPYDGPIWGKDWIDPLPTPPSLEHPLGTLKGYDIYYGCIWGTRTAFRIGLMVIITALAIGLSIGCVAGYWGGVIDELMMRFADIFFAFPSILLAMVLTVALPSEWPISFGSMNFSITLSSLDKLVVALALTGWPSYARVIRGEIVKIKHEDYVEAAKASGCSDLRVLSKHVLPNAIYPILVMVFLNFGRTVLSAATLSFLGFGPEVGYADWATIISHARNYVVGSPQDPFKWIYVWIIPSIFISAFIIGWSLVGDSLRDILDPTIWRR